MSTRASSRYDAIILGAGGAGMMCAFTAGQRGRKILLIDHADEPGKKILISGGGRCNFTNLHTPPERYLSANPHFAKSALRRFRPEDFIALVERHHIAWHEKSLGQLFCDGSARQIVAMLLEECAKGHVELRLGHGVRELEYADGMYRVSCGDEAAAAPALVIATGGLSIPKTGATGFAYDLARRFGLAVLAPRPALVPLTLGNDETLFQSLSGVSTDVVARCGDVAFREAALFTHKGLSGPAILQISSCWAPGAEIGIDFLPQLGSAWLVEAKRSHPRSALRSVLAHALPARLAEALAERMGVRGELANAPDRVLEDAQRRLVRLALSPHRHRRVCQSRGHGRRDQHGRAVLADHASQERERASRDRRSGGCDGLAWRLQFSMGLGQRLGGRSGSVGR